MKYEMIFGDEKLFDGAPDDAEYAGWFCQEIRWYMILNGKILFSDCGTWRTSDNPYLSSDIAAMRRIIKEPKRWTVEDQKAGRLPEVSIVVSYHRAKGTIPSEITSYWREGDILEIMKDLDEGLFSVFNKRTETCSNLVIDCIMPIETTDEKAARLEEEWVELAYENTCVFGGTTDDEKQRLIIHLRSVYRAQLSGELPIVTVKEETK